MRNFLLTAATVAIATLAGTAIAQESPTDRKPTEEVLPQVDDRPAPAPQGTRPPEMTATDTKSAELSEALRRIWEQPVDLQGNPIR